MENIGELREILGKLDFEKLAAFPIHYLKHFIDNSEIHPVSDILFALTIEGSDIDAAYKCIRILTQKHPTFLRKTDRMGINTLSLLYTHNELGKEVVLKLLLDKEFNIDIDILFLRNSTNRWDLSHQSLASLILNDTDFILPRINSTSVLERLEKLSILATNTIDSNGKTILHHELALSSLDIFKTLVERHGAELIRDFEGKTPYDIAKEKCKKEIVSFLEDRISKHFVNYSIPLKRLRSQEALEIIAVKGFDTFINAYGMNPSRYLVYNSKMHRVSLGLSALLIENGANVNEKDEFGITPLMHAASQGKFDIVKLLIKNGANVNAKDVWGSTPLYYAGLTDNTYIAKLLIENGAKPSLFCKGIGNLLNSIGCRANPNSVYVRNMTAYPSHNIINTFKGIASQITAYTAATHRLQHKKVESLAYII